MTIPMLKVTHYVRYMIERNGRQKQLVKAAEECSELAVECSKAANGEGIRAKIVEETCDVLLMIEQLKEMYLIDDAEIRAGIADKMTRQMERERMRKNDP